MFKGHRVSVWGGSSGDGWWGWFHNNVGYAMPLNYTVYNGYNASAMVTFVMYILTQFFKSWHGL